MVGRIVRRRGLGGDHGFSLETSIPVLTVFVQGLLSFFSPCVLPLIPLYVGYLAGRRGEDER